MMSSIRKDPFLVHSCTTLTMNYTGHYHLSHPKDQVWSAITDPAVLKQALPRCEKVIRHDALNFYAVFRVRLGMIPLHIGCDITLCNVLAPHCYTMQACGRGQIAKKLAGQARVTLTETTPSTTTLAFDAQGTLDGPLAQLATALVHKTAKKLADDFFAHLDDVIE